MTHARTHKAAARKRDIRAAKTCNARDAIGTLAPGAELYVLTMGQFSIADAIVALTEQTGPVHVTLATWTAADADLHRTAQLLQDAVFLSLRFLVDRSFITRQPAYCATMRRLFGDDCIRTARTHAKFVTLHNDAWTLAVRTSMNLNENPRMESLEISDDPALCGFLESVADEVFTAQAPGDFNGQLPGLAGIDGVDATGKVRMGRVARPLTHPRTGPTPS